VGSIGSGGAGERRCLQALRRRDFQYLARLTAVSEVEPPEPGISAVVTRPPETGPLVVQILPIMALNGKED